MSEPFDLLKLLRRCQNGEASCRYVASEIDAYIDRCVHYQNEELHTRNSELTQSLEDMTTYAEQGWSFARKADLDKLNRAKDLLQWTRYAKILTDEDKIV